MTISNWSADLLCGGGPGQGRVFGGPIEKSIICWEKNVSCGSYLTWEIEALYCVTDEILVRKKEMNIKENRIDNESQIKSGDFMKE